MKRKKEYGLLAMLLVAGMVAGGCSNDNSGGIDNPARPGDTIRFSVADVKTRTAYVDSFQINWQVDDQIGIYSIGAYSANGTTPAHAVYKIGTVDVDNHAYHGSLLPVEDDEYLKWTSDEDKMDEKCTFYGAYPAERIMTYPDGTGTTGKFSMQYWTNQTCTVNTSTSTNGQYRTTPDMQNAYMMARNEMAPNGDHVLLAFDPIMTTLDITVTAGKYEVGTGIVQPVTVTGVSVIMPKKLNSETLDYEITGNTNNDPEAPRGELVNTVSDAEESIFINIDNNGRKYIDLYEGESINLMAFLPPIEDLTGVQVRIHTAGAFNFTTKPTTATLEQQSKIYVKLPDVSPQTEGANNWISKLDGNMPLKKMSIPGYVCTESESATEIQSLLKKGVRAFDAAEFVTGNAISGFVLNEDFAGVLKSFLSTNSSEFIIIWANNNITSTLNNRLGSDKWTGFVESIGAARGKVVAVKKTIVWF